MILDTNAVSAVLLGDDALAEILGGEERHHLPVIVIGQYRYGLLRSASRARLEPLLHALVRECRVLLVDEETAEVYASVREALRAAGTPIPENDVWIAARHARRLPGSGARTSARSLRLMSPLGESLYT